MSMQERSEGTIVDKQIALATAEQLLEIKAVSINTREPFHYASGMMAPLYTDNRLLISNSKPWHEIIDYYAQVIKEHLRESEVLSGTATAAIPHAAVLAYRLEMPMVYVRASKKDHGKKNQIEGVFEKGQHVLVIEDLVSTGNSMGDNVIAIREAGGIVTHCLAITTSTISAFEQTVKDLNITLVTLTNIQTVVEVAKEKGYITAEEQIIVEKFLANPKEWGKAMGFE